MKISNVNVTLNEGSNSDKVLGYAVITIDNAIAIHGIRIMNGKDSVRVSMPYRKKDDGTILDIAHPINQDARNQVVNAILAKYNAMVAKKASGEEVPTATEEPAGTTEAAETQATE